MLLLADVMDLLDDVLATDKGEAFPIPLVGGRLELRRLQYL